MRGADADHLLAGDHEQLPDAQDRGADEQANCGRPDDKPRAGNNQQARPDPGRKRVVAAVDEAADPNSHTERQDRERRRDDTDPDQRQVELDRAV